MARQAGIEGTSGDRRRDQPAPTGLEPDAAGPVVRTTAGAVRGQVRDGVESYLGIPYAAPPFGPRRFDWPHPVRPWDGIRQATSYGPTSPQLPFAQPLSAVLANPIVEGEDILNLNVWAPARRRAGGPWPVMVWLHGGGLTRGGNSTPTYDGHAFARDGVVLVSVNYRLGAEGFSVLPGAPANLGVADQIAALHWVRREIAAFGGDPARVTVFGQSAGGTTLTTLLASPRAAGLFAQAILQSAPMGVSSYERGAARTRRLAERLGVPATRAGFARLDPVELVRAGRGAELGEPGWWRTPPMSYTPVIDGDLVPDDPRRALARGMSAGLPVLAGYNADEHRLWLAPGDFGSRITWGHVALLAGAYRIPPRVVRGYARLYRSAGAGETVGQVAQDLILRRPTLRLAEARRRHGGHTWIYEFAWRSPFMHLGAAHAMELPFVFDTLDSVTAESAAGVDLQEAERVATAMHQAWIDFARTGRCQWPQWGGLGPVLRFGSPGHAPAEVVASPGPPAVW